MSSLLRKLPRMAWSLVLIAAKASSAADTIPEPQDLPFAGVIRLEVDATDLDHRLFQVRETMPVAAPGPMTLYYPRWLPGNHSTTGPIDLLAGLIITTGDGRRLEWRRDTERMHAFHIDVPAGVSQLVLQFQFLTPVSGDWPRRVITPDLLSLQWEKALLYPAGHYSRQITFQPSIRLPPGWQYASALEGGTRDGDVVKFNPVSLEKLVDSPLFSGLHYRRVDLDTNPEAPVRLNIFADRPEELAATPEQLEAHRRVVDEALALFGSRHFAHYDFLLAISDNFSAIGLEHQESSENGVGLGYFTDWDGTATGRDLLPHEMVHSWNGKFRRPAGLWAPSYEIPVDPELLWVYEGMTEYFGLVLTARSGLWSPEFSRDALAQYAAIFATGRAGREWRNLQDTTSQPILSYRGAQTFPSWQRSKDYYTEGALLWLDVDTRLRELTRGQRSLDDFARAFFGVQNGATTPLTYTFDDVVAALQAVAGDGWAAFLRARLEGHGPKLPSDGLARAGWRLVYGSEPSRFTRSTDTAGSVDSFLFSLGLTANKEGKVMEVYWGSPAFKAGLAPGMLLIAVDGRAYSAALLRDAIKATQPDKSRQIALLVRKSDTYSTVSLDYHDGLRYPRLERIEGTEDRLSALLHPRTKAAKSRP